MKPTTVPADSLATLARWCLFALLVFAPLARGAVQGWAVTTIHLICLIAVTALLLSSSLTGVWTRIQTAMDGPIGVLVILAGVSAVCSVHRPTSFWAMVLVLDHVAVFYVVVYTVRTRRQLRQLLYLVIGMAVLLALLGFLKFLGHNPFSWWDYADIPQTGRRLTATFGNADHLAGYMEMAICLLVGLVCAGFRPLPPVVTLGAALLLAAALVFSLSRGGWAGAGAGFLFMTVYLWFTRGLRIRRMGWVVVMVGCAALLVAALSSTTVVNRILSIDEAGELPNLKSRMARWQGTLDIIADHPAQGTGPGTFATVFTQYQPPGFSTRSFYAHNDYLQFISETGLPMAVVMLWMVIVVYKCGFRKMRHQSRLVRGATLGAMSGLTAIVVHSVGDFNLHIPANSLLFTVLAAIVVKPVPDKAAPLDPLSDTSTGKRGCVNQFRGFILAKVLGFVFCDLEFSGNAGLGSSPGRDASRGAHGPV